MKSRHLIFIAIIAMITLSLGCAHPGSESAERVGEPSELSVDEHSVDEQSSEAAPEPLEPDAFVLIYSDARFYETPAADKRAHRVFERSRTQARQHFVNLFHGRVVEDHGEWLEIRTRAHGEPGPVCDTHSLLPHEPVMLRFFVRREALALTTTRPVAHDYEDGTGFELRPGLPLVPVEGKEGAYHVWSGDLAFTVELPDDAVGRSFSQYVEPGDEREFVAKASLDAGWNVGSTTLTFREQRRAGDLVYTEGMSKKGEDILLTLERRCSRITAMVESAIKVEPDEPKVRVTPAQEEEFPYYAVDEGAIVYWPRGEAAGVVTSEVSIPPEEAGGGSKVCQIKGLVSGYVARMDGDTLKDELEVMYCFERDDLKLVEEKK